MEAKYLHFEQSLRKSLLTGFIDKTEDSSDSLRPKLLLNKQPNRKILTTIIHEISTCNGFDLFVAFITKDGLVSLIETLKAFDIKGFKGRILTSSYLNFTDPDAIETINDSFKNIEIKVYDDHLHAKGYTFYHDEYATVIIGSSNLTAAALSSTRELNIQIISMNNGDMLHQVNSEFEEAWEFGTVVTPQWLKSYRAKYEAIEIVRRTTRNPLEDIPTNGPIVPNQMQVNAMSALNDLRTKGEKKGLLISATGTGKTLLSALDAYECKPKRLLFVVHREMIAKAAMDSFKMVFHNERSYELYKGGSSKPKADFVFAMVGMLSSHVKEFRPDEFDYMIVDEAHRSSAPTYQIILNHFTPKFLLGMTATPERTNGDDIYGNFDFNIAYEIRLSDAMKENLLCDFHYFGVTDLTINNEIVDDATQFSKLVSIERCRRIKQTINYYSLHSQVRKGLIFCSRNDEASDLSIHLNSLGMKTIALSGNDDESERESAIKKLEDGTINYILTVDIFNEGVDIPFVNQVIMLRPTQSAIIFVQQLGRGLRKLEGKNYLTVIDFIGNYQNNFLIPVALFGDNSYNKDTLRKLIAGGSLGIYGNSTIDFDRISKEQIYRTINQTNFSNLKFLYEQYDNLKNKLNRIPKLMDFQNTGSISPLRFCQSVGKYKTYFEFKCRREDANAGQFLMTNKHLESLRFFSQILPRGLRPQELLLIRSLIDEEKCLNKVREKAQKLSNCILTDESWISAFRILQNGFFKTAEKDAFGNLSYIKVSNNIILPTEDFSNLLNNNCYRDELNDIIEVGFSELKKRFESDGITNPGNLVINSKYSRKDVCILLNWDANVESTMYGYKMEYQTNTCPVFVTYEKDVDNITTSTNYQDEIRNEERFLWYSRSRRTLESQELQGIINQAKSQTRVLLFVKKSDDEGTDFYYLGDMKTLSAVNTKIGEKNDFFDVVKFDFQMINPIDENLLVYLKSKPLGVQNPQSDQVAEA